MKIGVIGTGLMGSNLARCLVSKGYEVILYNRTKAKAKELAREINGVVVDSPREALDEAEAAIAFISDDEALYDIVFQENGLIYSRPNTVFINASTVTPMASMRVYKVLRNKGIGYVEAPVYGSTSEACECRLLSIVAAEKPVYDRVKQVIETYSFKTYYIGEIPKAMALKLALNNIGLALPALMAESLALLEAWGVELELFKEVSENLWFGEAIKRYWPRIMEEKPPRFKTWMAGKDYWYIASTLKAKKLPSYLAETLSSMYMNASKHGYDNKDYPQITRYYIEIAKKHK